MTSLKRPGGFKGLICRASRRPNLRISLATLFLVLLIVVLGPWVAPYDPDALLGAPFAAPQRQWWLGLDYLGRDALSRTLYGGWSILWMSVSASVGAVGAGALLGISSAFIGGRVDHLVVWCTDVLLAFPDLLLVLLIVSIMGSEPWLMVLTIALALIPGAIRLARGVTLNVAAQEFVEAAKLVGLPTRHIILGEILPNIVAPLLVHFGVTLMASIALLATLGFLGFGVSAPTADWGLMVHENRAGLLLQPWVVAAPIFLIAAFSLSANMAAESLGRQSDDGDGSVDPQ